MQYVVGPWTSLLRDLKSLHHVKGTVEKHIKDMKGYKYNCALLC